MGAEDILFLYGGSTSHLHSYSFRGVPYLISLLNGALQDIHARGLPHASVIRGSDTDGNERSRVSDACPP
eukprot:4536558-Prymnesium_polylepis.1